MAEHRISRDELYALVWREPIIRVANRFGVSDVAVAKACRKYQIPLPGRGYWARLKAGQKLQRPPLPQLSQPGFQQVSFTPGQKLPNVDAAKRERDPEQRIVVAEEPDQLHPLARRALVVFSRKHGNEFTSPETDTLDIRVSADQVGRAVRLSHALITALEAWGHAVTVSPDKVAEPRMGVPTQPGPARTRVLIGKIELIITIEEETRRIPHIPTKAEERDLARGNRWNIPTHDVEPTGELCVRIVEPRRNHVRSVWRDAKKPLEQSLNKVVEGFLVAAQVEREQREK